MNFDTQVMIDTIWVVMRAVPRTFGIAAVVLVIGILLGAVFAQLKMKPVPVITPLVRLIVSYMRGVPLIVHSNVSWAALREWILHIIIATLFVIKFTVQLQSLVEST